MRHMLCGGVAALIVLAGCERSDPIDYGGPVAGWDHWGGSAGGSRYSPLTQITPGNVQRLEVAWTYHIGTLRNPAPMQFPTLEATAVLGDGRLYLCSPLNRVVALDPESGRELWSFDPEVNIAGIYVQQCRGVTFHRDDSAAAGGSCAARVLTGTLDGRLIALDATNGRPCEDFGEHGTVDLRAGLGEVKPGDYALTSPPVVVAGRIVLGGHIVDNARLDVPAGVVRAFELRTGALSWAWNSVPPDRTDPKVAGTGDTYTRGTANAWSVFSVDHERGLVFVPTGNTSPDLFGGLRDGLDHYSSSLVALDATSGRVVWHFQTVHHDVWDFDVPAQPVLFDFPGENGPVAAVAQATKQGHIFILNRETGEPLIPVEERPVPQGGAVDGEAPAPTQPFPVNEAYTVHPGNLSEEAMWGFTPWDRGKCRELFRKHRYEGRFSLPSLEGTITFPFSNGLLNWGSVSIDPERKVLVTNSTRIAAIVTLIPRQEADARLKAGERFNPAFGTPYASKHEWMLSPLGAPCNPPPWGTLLAIDLEAGKRLWEVPLGTTRELAPWPFWMKLGVPNIGGSLLTASGLAFIGASTDGYFRAFDVVSGKRLWEHHMNAGVQATPMTYRLKPDGKQYVVIAAGGHGYLGSKLGDSIVAFTLSD